MPKCRVLALVTITACSNNTDTTGEPASTTVTLTTTADTTAADTTPSSSDPTTTAPDPSTTSTTSSTTTTTVDPTTTAETTSETTAESTGAPLACPIGFFCEDFESHPAGTVPGAPWTADIGDASLLVDTSKSVSGTNAIHLTTGNAYGGRALLGINVPELFPATHLYGRLRMWLTQASPDGVHWTMIAADGTTQAPGVWGDQPFAATIRYGGQHQQRLMANYDTPGYYNDSGPGSDCWHHSEQKIPEQAWTCMEWEFNSDTREMHFWLDGQEVADLTVGGMGQGCINHDTMDQWYYPTLENMTFGWVDYQDGGSRELWIDDITIGPTRVGCDP